MSEEREKAAFRHGIIHNVSAHIANQIKMYLENVHEELSLEEIDTLRKAASLLINKHHEHSFYSFTKNRPDATH